MDILFLYIEDGGRKYDKKRTFKFKEKHRKNDFIICNNCRYYQSRHCWFIHSISNTKINGSNS